MLFKLEPEREELAARVELCTFDNTWDNIDPIFPNADKRSAEKLGAELVLYVDWYVVGWSLPSFKNVVLINFKSKNRKSY